MRESKGRMPKMRRSVLRCPSCGRGVSEMLYLPSRNYYKCPCGKKVGVRRKARR